MRYCRRFRKDGNNALLSPFAFSVNELAVGRMMKTAGMEVIIARSRDISCRQVSRRLPSLLSFPFLSLLLGRRSCERTATASDWLTTSMLVSWPVGKPFGVLSRRAAESHAKQEINGPAPDTRRFRLFFPPAASNRRGSNERMKRLMMNDRY